MHRIALAGLFFLFSPHGISQVTKPTIPKGIEDEKFPTTDRDACDKAVQAIHTTKPFESETTLDSREHLLFWIPTQIEDRLHSLKSDLAMMYRASASPKGEASPIGRKLSENLAQFAQDFVESIAVPPQGKRLTCLLRFGSDESGAILWQTFFVVMGDANAFRTYPSSTFAVRPQSELSVSILARDIDRAKLSSVIAIQNTGMGPACGPLLPEHIPSPSVRR